MLEDQRRQRSLVGDEEQLDVQRDQPNCAQDGRIVGPEYMREDMMGPYRMAYHYLLNPASSSYTERSQLTGAKRSPLEKTSLGREEHDAVREAIPLPLRAKMNDRDYFDDIKTTAHNTHASTWPIFMNDSQNTRISLAVDPPSPNRDSCFFCSLVLGLREMR